MNLIDLVKKIRGCEEVSKTLCEIQKFLNDKDVNVEHSTVQDPKISYSEGLKPVETALQYFEQQGADLLFLRRLGEEASRRKVQSRKQQDITHFFNKQ